MDPTTDPTKKSFIPVSEHSHFPIQNLPYGVFKSSNSEKPRVGVAIGDYVLDLSVLESEGYFEDIYPKENHFFSESTLNKFISQNRTLWKKVRSKISHLLDENTNTIRDNNSLRKKSILDKSTLTLILPVRIGDYTDFYSSTNQIQKI